MTDTLLHVEFETKYKVEGDIVYPFKALVQSLPEQEEFVYVESDDIYFVDHKGDFARYRFSNSKSDLRAEVTWKFKPEGARDNIRRVEFNWRVDGTPSEVIHAALDSQGYKRNFRISKIVHVYKFADVTVPFYTVIDEQGKMQHFIEIEIREDKAHSLTEDQAWEIISKWEKILSPLGITAQKRLRKSLFEMYRK